MRQRHSHWGMAVLSVVALLGFSGSAVAAPGPSVPVVPNVWVVGVANDLAAAAPGSYLRQTGARAIDVSQLRFQLSDVQYFVVHGLPQANGQYSYPYHVTAPPGEYVVTEELGTNSQTHTQLIEAGVATAASVAAETAANGTEASSAPSTLTNPNLPSPGDPSDSGYFETVWHDPFDLTVAYIKDNISWNYGGGFISSFTYNDDWYDFNLDGWSMPSRSIPN